MTNAVAHQIRTGCRATVGLFALGLLASCAGDLMTYNSSVSNLQPEEAVVMPPPGGPAIVSVLEKQYSNAIDQQIMLRTDARTAGQNAINAVFFGTRNFSPMNGNNLSYRSITERRIDQEMREEMPGVRMVRSPYYVQNNYGPFGYAFGPGRGSDLCMYGWQQIRPNQDSLSAFGQAGTIQIRVRFCEAGASEDDLLGIMYGYTINATVGAFGWNPYGDQAGPSPLLGETGAPTYPRAAYDERPERVANTEKVLKTSTRRTVPSSRTVTTRQTGDEINLDVVRLPPGSLPSAGYSGLSAPPGVMPPAASSPGLPSVGSGPASTLPTPGRQTTTTGAASVPTRSQAAPSAANIPGPARTAPAASPATSPTSTSAAPPRAAPSSGISRSIPTPPCRLLPGSTTVSCE